ncbi:MAG: hypothetical protein CVU44_03695 [Chloroflexi bacterium HGW-Chloroflexi-6]|nr:MAG: hypothetical protein CVU44_03695 [Chloroflexi bacterium HGW-Chloroflexi-6]
MTTLSDTQPTPVRQKRRFGFVIGLLIITAALLFGSLGGYFWGVDDRVQAAEATRSQALGEQFAMAQEDFAARRLDIARQRIEYILQNDPGYPGGADMLAQIMIQMAITPSPTVTPSPTITPTPDLREQEAIFAQAQAQLTASDWDGAIATLDGLRKRDVTYRTAQIDGMYFIALRNRGAAKILGQGIYAALPNLEGGIYDLTLAERFGPLDGQAAGYRNFARMYIQGASFWELDWAQAVNYFGEISRYTPNLRDGSNITATERYRIALLNYGDVLNANQRLNDRCPALNQWAQAANIVPLDAEYSAKFNELNLECNPPTNTPEPFTPTVEVAVPEATIEPTIEPTVTP